MNIVFMGTPDFAVPSLELLLKNGYTVAAVVTAPDKPRGRGQKISATAVKQCAERHSLPVLQPEDLRDEKFLADITILHPDLFIVVAFRILPPELYSVPLHGAFNLHASLLPKYRGAAPIQWAIMNGETETGVTTFFLQEKVDTGSIILQARVAITPTMTAGELHDLLAEVGAEIVFQTVKMIELGKVVPHKQDDAIATPAPKIFPDQCRIDWTKPAAALHNFIRGLSPHPAAWTMHGETLLKIYRAKIGESTPDRSKPGSVMLEQGQFTVCTGEGTIQILELQQEGKRRMTADEFLRGYKFVGGKKFV